MNFVNDMIPSNCSCQREQENYKNPNRNWKSFWSRKPDWLTRAQSPILFKPYKSNKNWRWIQNPKLKKSKLLWRWTRAWPTLSSAQQEALPLPQTASPLSAKTGDDCDDDGDDGWADLKSVCAFFFIFFSPVLFLFICFSPAWEAAPSPPPPSQAQLRQVSSTIDDIPCPYCWCLTTACPMDSVHYDHSC